MAREFRVFGPPGTGKTTYLVGEIARLAKKVGPDKIALASFTRAGALEILGRVDLELGVFGMAMPDRNVGTVHSLANRSIDGGTPIAEVDAIAEEWNRRWAVAGEAWPVSGKAKLADDVAVHGAANDAGASFLSDYSRVRNRYPKDPVAWKKDQCWSKEMAKWVEEWEKFKDEFQALDFTDLIEQAGSLDPQIQYLVVDEAQDLTPLEAGLVRRWAEDLEMLVMAGDDDQAIYNFRGGSPLVMLEPIIPDEMQKVLSQSYRLPSIIKDYSEKMIVSSIERRKEKIFASVRQGGYIERTTFHYREIGDFGDRVEKELERLPDRDVMILASCAFLLVPIIKELKSRAIAFHNPYRTSRGDWQSGQDRMSMRLKMFCKGLPEFSDDPGWTAKEFSQWASTLMAKKLPKDAMPKKDIAAFGSARDDRGLIVKPGDCEMILGIEAKDLTVEWFFSMLTPKNFSDSEHAKVLYATHGPAILDIEPKVIIGTVHSVKGAQAETVFLIPEVSKASMVGEHTEVREGLARTFYVGMTRAKGQLIMLRKMPGKPGFDFPKPVDQGEQIPMPEKSGLQEPVPF